MKHELKKLLPVLRRFARSLTRTADDADDLVQATVERLLVKGIPRDSDISRWAFTVCRNLWIDEHRARKVRLRASHDPALQARQIVDGERHVHAQMQLEKVDAALQQLPDDQRLVLAMVVIQGMSYKAVAESLELPAGTVMSRLARARARLVELLEPDKPAARKRDGAGKTKELK